MKKNEKKEQKKALKRKQKACSLKTIRKMKRSDGLTMWHVNAYTMRAVVECTATRYGKYLAMCTYQDENSEVTYRQMESAVKHVGLYLLSQGFQKGDKIALMGEGCPTWMLAYLGITSVGLVAVPILPDFPAKDVLNILAESEAKATVISGKQFEKCLPLVGTGHRFIRLDDLFEIPMDITKVSNRNEFMKAPGTSISAYKPTKGWEKIWADSAPKEEDLASLIFTSGTTGRSKGVLLTHKNLVWNADESSVTFFHVHKKDKILSFLPLSHVYEFTTAQILGLICGAEIHYLGKPAAPSFLMPALSDIRPVIMMTVPLLIEKVYKSAVKPVFENNKKLQPWLKWSVSRKLISRTAGRKLRLAFGGRLKFLGIGGAPLDPQVEHFLYDANFPYAQGYGLTETSPMICGHGPKNHRLGMLGKVIKGETVRLDNKNAEGVGEVLVKGPNVMQGYYKDDALNKESFTEDGFFRTGDLGVFDKKGWLGLRGRLKTMILGSGGENIYPEVIEALFNSQDFVTESLVVPEDGGLLALVKIDLESYAKSMAIGVSEAKADAAKYIANLKQNINKDLSSYSKISTVKLQEEPFQRTPTLKIKRFLYGRKKEEQKTEQEKGEGPEKKD